MIRNDISHVMHLISGWSELKSSTFRIKNFYMRSIGLIIVSTNFEDMKLLFKNIFTVALHETEGINSNNEPTECEHSKTYLKRRIATHDIEFEENNTNIDDLNEPILNMDDKQMKDLQNTSIFDIVINIYETVLESSNHTSNAGDRDNMQFSPGISKRLLYFCKLIPCWSSIMIPIFQYGNKTESSSVSESLFKDLKSVVFKHKSLPIRLDEFLKIHINSIIGSTNLLASKTAHMH
jgi:hypothetical protein